MVLDAIDEPEPLCPLGQLDRTVVAEQEVTGDVADGRAAGISVATDGQQQLMMAGGQPSGVGPLLAPMQEPAQPRPEGQEALVVLVPQRRSCHDMVSLRVPRNTSQSSHRS